MRILGIDPGTTRVGYGLINKEGGRLIHLEHGILNVSSESDAGRLLDVESEANALLGRTKPDIAGVEKLFFTKNRTTGIAVAQARGIIIATLAKHNIPFQELTPSAIKLAVTGDGRASKGAVAKMVHYFLKIETKNIIDDATDALAIAIAISSNLDLK